MDVHVIEGVPDDERVAAVVALAVQSYLASETQDPNHPMQAVGRWKVAGRLEAHGVSTSPGQVKGHWARDVW